MTLRASEGRQTLGVLVRYVPSGGLGSSRPLVRARNQGRRARGYYVGMPALDFREIAEAHAGKDRDQFELFARDFLESQGFETIVGPDRGVDAGRDLVVREYRNGPGGTTRVDWLVSCKHKAHSGAAVSLDDDGGMRDRIETHGCDGFMAFYSTLPSSTFSKHLEALKPKYELIVYDREKTEAALLSSNIGQDLAARYFPASFARWVARRTSAAVPAFGTEGFFIRSPHTGLEAAKAEAEAKELPVFVAVFDPAHPTRSRFAYSVGYFMEWETTKRLVDDHFVVAVGPSSDPAFGALVPEDDPLEECRWIVLLGDVELRSESFYASPSEGRKRVREAIEQAATDQGAVPGENP